MSNRRRIVRETEDEATFAQLLLNFCPESLSFLFEKTVYFPSSFYMDGFNLFSYDSYIQ